MYNGKVSIDLLVKTLYNEGNTTELCNIFLDNIKVSCTLANNM